MSVAGKPGYKETALGWIPGDWQLKTVGEVCDVKGGKRLPKGESLTEENTGFPYIRVTNMRMGGINSADILYVPKHVQPLIAQYTISKDDLFISVAGTLGVVGFVPENLDGANLTENADKLTEISVSRDFLFHVLCSEPIQAMIQKEGTSNAQPKLALTRIRDFAFSCPNGVEQQKIAAILTAVDDKLEVIARQISATQTLKQGLMQTLFTRGAGTQDAQGRWHPHTEFQDTELGRIPLGWSVTTLEQVANVERGKFSARPRNDPRYFEAGDIPFIQTGDIAAATRYVSQSSQFINEDGLAVSRLFPVGTIFITIAANIGDVAMAKIPMACPDSLVGILPSSALCDGMWLYYLLKNSKDYFDSQSTQNAQKNINLQVLRPFAFGLPSLAEQAHIAGCLSSVDDKLEALTTKQTHYQSLKRGLMQKLLTGAWRVQVD